MIKSLWYLLQLDIYLHGVVQQMVECAKIKCTVHLSASTAQCSAKKYYADRSYGCRVYSSIFLNIII